MFKRELISYIVSSYDRPKSLAVLLASIETQTEPHESIVCCNARGKLLEENRKVAKHFGAKFCPTGEWGAYCCYSSADLVVSRGIPKGQWLAFPCDDTIYMQGFSDIMMREVRENSWDLVYCDMVNDPMTHPGVNGRGRYGIFHPRPRFNGTAKDQFIVRASLFNGFPGKSHGGLTACDGLFVQDLVKRGVRHGKAPGILLVHQ